MKKTFMVLAAIVVIAVAIIIVNAPPPDDATSAGDRPIPVAAAFAILEAENDVVRQLWTERVVGDGQRQGLEFGEDWRELGSETGPLPALFLRETAENLRRDPAPLYLFLGSDFPINDANKFTGVQMQHFAEIKRTGAPQFFLDAEIGMQTAMFSDIAVDETCVSCHNNDPEAPKTDWKVGFANPPAVGDRWPVDGHFLPSAGAFMQEAERRASPATLHALLQLGYDEE